MFKLLILQDLYLKQRTAVKNKIHGEKALGTPSKTVSRSLTRMLKQLEKELAQRESLIRKTQEDQLEQLTSIPGMGKKLFVSIIKPAGNFMNALWTKERVRNWHL